MLHHGLYEQIINNAPSNELAEIPEARKAVQNNLLYQLIDFNSPVLCEWASFWGLPGTA